MRTMYGTMSWEGGVMLVPGQEASHRIIRTDDSAVYLDDSLLLMPRRAYVFASICLFVCLPGNNILWKAVNKIWWNFQDCSKMTQGTTFHFLYCRYFVTAPKLRYLSDFHEILHASRVLSGAIFPEKSAWFTIWLPLFIFHFPPKFVFIENVVLRVATTCNSCPHVVEGLLYTVWKGLYWFITMMQ